MTSPNRPIPGPDRIADVICSLQLPLENVEFALEQYLLDNAQWLDTETRILLAGVRDTVGRVAQTARRLSDAAIDRPSGVGHAA